MLDSMSESDIPFKGKTERRRRRGRRRMHSSLRGYVTIKRRPAGIYSRGGARIARLPDRSFMLLSRGTPTERRAILVLQTTPICWFVGHCFGTKLVHTWSAAVREETEGTAGGRWGEGGTASSAGGIGWNLVRNIRDPPELGLRRGLQPSLWIWPCAHTFSKLNFDPPGWKGSHCRRQFSIFSPSAPLSLPLCPRYLPSPSLPRLVPSSSFSRGGAGATRIRRIRCCWTLENFSRELALPPLSLSLRRKGCHLLPNSSPGFPPFAPLGDDASDAAQLNF